jgi:phosphate transport system substrate-binding protein
MGDHPRRSRLAVMTGLLAVGAIALSACGSDSNDNSGGTNPPAGNQSNAGNQTNTPGTCAKGTLKSDGSTAQQNAMTQWIKDYQTKCTGATVTYGGGGSGLGVTDFEAGQVDFAGSDAALNPAAGEVSKSTRACGSQAIDIPMVTGPIAIAYNVSGVDKLILTPGVLAKIMLGKITSWNDAAIKAINPGVSLPSTKITVFNRADESGTTQNFESYLAASAPSVWTAVPSKDWAGVGQGKQGNPLLGAAVKATPGAIGYVEWSYAIQNNLPEAQIDNGGGPVTLTAVTVGKTVSTAKIAPSGPGDLTLKLDYATKTPGAYPILLVTYEVVCTKYKDAATGTLVKSFLNFIASSAEQNAVHNLGYAALPAAVSQKVQAQIAKIS